MRHHPVPHCGFARSASATLFGHDEQQRGDRHELPHEQERPDVVGRGDEQQRQREGGYESLERAPTQMVSRVADPVERGRGDDTSSSQHEDRAERVETKAQPGEGKQTREMRFDWTTGRKHTSSRKEPGEPTRGGQHPGDQRSSSRMTDHERDAHRDDAGRHRGRQADRRETHRPVRRRKPRKRSSGLGGQPGISRSTGTKSPTAPATPYPPAKTPQFRAQSPTATTSFGDAAASYVFIKGVTMLWVTGPVTAKTSAWRGEATRRTPKRSAS